MSSGNGARVNMMAGAGAGVINCVLCSPLDVAKVRQQLQGAFVPGSPKYEGVFSTVRTIYKEEGAPGLFRGLRPSLMTMPLFWAIYFPVYGAMNQRLALMSNGDSATWQHCVAAITAGFAADCATNPLWVVRTRMISDIYHSPDTPTPSGLAPNGAESPAVTRLGVFRRMLYIGRTEGVTALYKGLSASMLGLSHVAIQFPVYEKFKQFARRHRNDSKETILDLIVSSALSKAIASTITYPHEVVRSRLQDSRSRTRLRDVVHRIMVEEGWHGFFRGLQVNLVRVLPSCVTVFVSYELISRAITTQFPSLANSSS
ncbi:NAD+ transporter [Salpingoeca rosetta]|uniref:NAD+ transporter n=1 Tax=Salpingoeca rosetta (strain ATCC 50818 / BSB-021) TaxID=946362 RepID=F2TZA2_SALR5|nr:NAD+ transporter [Salpingoeca rosetta]EGD78926.1 NAD+ transporter [Salpingoeca rosetta]|eukprot:XP_004997882.1 NAD+ transporter [Salpingoeca rosetta]